MKLVLAMVLAFASLPSLIAADDEALANELKLLSGSWKLVSVEVGGRSLPASELPAVTFTLKPNGISDVQTPDGEFQTKAVLDPSAWPKTIDIDFLGGKHKGLVQYGIYKIEMDRWTVFYTPPGGRAADRPKEFDSRIKTANGGLLVWERKKERKSP